jgi:hypothetical protein
VKVRQLKPPKQPRSSSGFLFPRVVALDAPGNDSLAAKQRLVEPMTLVLLLPEDNNYLKEHELKLNLLERTFQQNDCQPILNVSIYPTCNSVHELDLVGGDEESTPLSLLSMLGTWRSVWRLDDPLWELPQVQVPLVLKVLLLKRDYTQESFAMHAIDARTMEQLTASPHVVDIYSFCGQSQLSEFGNNARLSIKDPSLHFITRLRMARDLARGLADLHAYRPLHDYKRKNRSLPAVFAHHDINLANLIRTNRTKNGASSSSSDQNVQIKWNDFNLGVPLRQNKKTGTACPIPVRYVNPLWQSPEEIQNANNTTGGGVHGAQADVYSFGSLLYLLVARHQPWTHLETEKTPLSIETVMQKKIAGEMPNMPSKYIAKTEAKIMWEAIQACYRLDPQMRPTAYELAQAIGTGYNWIRNNNKTPITIESVRVLFEKKKVSE